MKNDRKGNASIFKLMVHPASVVVVLLCKKVIVLYTTRARSYLCLQKFRRRVQESTKVLRELEISLRTNHIG